MGIALAVTSQDAITKHNAAARVDDAAFYRVFQASRAVREVVRRFGALPRAGAVAP